MSELVRVGIIGCGNVVVRGHAPALLELEEAKVVGVADPVEENRRLAQEAMGLRDSAAFADHRSLLDVGVDYILLAVPPKYRRPIVEDCAKAGVHVLSEKPIAIVPAEGQVIIDTMHRAGLCFGLVHNYLYFPHFVLAKQLIDEGAIGTLHHATLQWLGMPDLLGSAAYRPRWRYDPEDAGGGILMDMLHVFYMAAFFLDGPIRAVSAVVDNFKPDRSVEDFALVHCYGDSVYVTINLWWGRGPMGSEFSGTAGHILHFSKDWDVGQVMPQFTLVNDDGHKSFPVEGDFYLSSFAGIHGNFVTAVREGVQPIAPGEAGLTALETALASYASAATGRVVSLPLANEEPLYQWGISGLKGLALWDDGPVRQRGVFGL
jgi:predicted dehydrogenase